MDFDSFARLVAPRAGAWIETLMPLRMVARESVAPRAGAWIETHHEVVAHSSCEVAPRAGAWIETFFISQISSPLNRRSPCGSVD